MKKPISVVHVSTLASGGAGITAVGRMKGEPFEDVVSIGSLGDERLMALAWAAADVFVVPSRQDNSPNVILEAHASGTPVVALPTGGTPELIEDGFDGVLADDVSPDALAAAIGQALSMPFDRDRIRERAVERFRLEVIAAQYEEVYRSLLEKRPVDQTSEQVAAIP